MRAPWVRQALAYATNRQAVVTQIFKKFNPNQQVLQNLTYGNTQKGKYVPHFGAYTYSPSKVAAIMQKHNCTKGSDGIFVCNGQKMSIKFGTTTGNKLRELVQEIVMAQAKAAGIEFVPDNDPSRLFFPRVSDGNYQIAMFAWVGTGDPIGQTDIYGIGGGSNWKGYNSVKVTNLFKAVRRRAQPGQADRARQRGGREHGAERADASDRPEARDPRLQDEDPGHAEQPDLAGPHRQHAGLVGQVG